MCYSHSRPDTSESGDTELYFEAVVKKDTFTKQWVLMKFFILLVKYFLTSLLTVAENSRKVTSFMGSPSLRTSPETS